MLMYTKLTKVYTRECQNNFIILEQLGTEWNRLERIGTNGTTKIIVILIVVLIAEQKKCH